MGMHAWCRGLVACANANTPHSNGSQFFITLDRCDHLDRKHTIFGKVTGESIYNAMHLNELEASLLPLTALALAVCSLQPLLRSPSDL